MRKVFSMPTLEMAERDMSGGISQVVVNVARHLPEFGWEMTDNEGDSDIVVAHATDQIQADVLHCHGLYPTGEPNFDGQRAQIEINRRLIEAARRTPVLTVPSEWVADIFRRDMHIDPVVTRWGIDHEQWKHDGTHGGYVLWNKNRTEGVCTPTWINQLAMHEGGVKFVSTFGADNITNLKLTGRIPHDNMRDLVKHASLYLATTKETGDIGSREALAAGVPVLGFRYGALPDFLVHGYNGFLAEPGDFDGLVEGLHWCLRNRDKLSKNALKSAKSFTWKDAAKAFSVAYDRALELKNTTPRISVVIPCYNYAQFLPDAIRSTLEQQTQFDFEVIVVDDGSNDGSADVARDFPVTLIEQENQGVAHARNRGIEAASGNLIACLDADDVMGEGFLETCGMALQSRVDLGLAYTGLTIMGSGRPHTWPVKWDYKMQIKRENRVPSLCMFRKEAWGRAGGFRQYMHPAEDADMWTRIAAIGYDVEQVTTAPLHVYRVHGQGAIAKQIKDKRPDPFRNPFIGYRHNGMAGGAHVWPVKNYDEALIDIFVVLDGSGRFQQTCDSIEGQGLVKWQITTIGKTPFRRILTHAHAATLGKGLKASRCILGVLLHEGDHLHPDFLSHALEKYRQTGRYVYTDWYTHDGANKKADRYVSDKRVRHPVATLMAVEDMRLAKSVKTLYQDLAELGICGHHVPETLLITDHVFTKEASMCKCNERAPVIEPANPDAIKVQYLSQMQGNHNVVGNKTGKRYGRHKGGDRFYIYVDDFDASRFVKLDTIELPTNRTMLPADL